MIDAVWRIESPKLIAGLSRIVRDIGVAEDLAQEAFISALVQWPESGIPHNPGAWLMSVAKRRAIDRFRRAEALERKHAAAGYDRFLTMPMFVACHPVLALGPYALQAAIAACHARAGNLPMRYPMNRS